MTTPFNQDSGGDYSMGEAIEPGALKQPDLEARIEALLFVSSSGVTFAQLAATLGVTPLQIEKSLDELDQRYQSCGLRLQRINRSVQLTTAPEIAEDIQRFLQLEETTRFSRASLEVLAIIAYQQPVTRPQIDAVRGVNSDSVLRNLLRYGLITEVGRSEGPGRPILYATTPEFFSHFGISSLDQLPPLNIELDQGEISVLFDGDPRTEAEEEGDG
jgi:segregation and condensation protein B